MFIQFGKQIFTKHNLCSRYRWFHFAMAPTLSHFLSVSFLLLCLLHKPITCFFMFPNLNSPKRNLLSTTEAVNCGSRVISSHPDLFCLKLTHYWPHNRVLSWHLQVENFLGGGSLISAIPWRKGAGRISGNTRHSFQSNNDLGLISYSALDRACVSRLPLLPVVPHTKLKFFCLLPLSLCTDLF